MPHPVRAIGLMGRTAERFWRKTRLPYARGGRNVLDHGRRCNRIDRQNRAAFSSNIYWIYAFLACRDLDIHAGRVISALEGGDLAQARRKLSLIVGRDTADLERKRDSASSDRDGRRKPERRCYRAALLPGNRRTRRQWPLTRQSIRWTAWSDTATKRYREFGFVSAKMDDLANFVPARLSAVLVWCAAAFVPGLSAIRAFRTTLRDARNQPSPNAGFPEAAVAGALGVQLGGLNSYGGVPSRKATLGDPIVELDRRAYKKVRVLLYAVEAMFVGLVSTGADADDSWRRYLRDCGRSRLGLARHC